MQIYGISERQWDETVYQVSTALYGGNVILSADTHEIRGPRSVRTVGTLRVKDSRGLGARTSWSGRHGPWACWHVYRDVIREALRKYPHARFVTAMARYDASNFEETYPDTAHKNVGSVMSPAYMPELCVSH